MSGWVNVPVPDPPVVEVLREYEYHCVDCRGDEEDESPWTQDAGFAETLATVLEPLFRARESRAWDAGFGSGKQAEISAYWDRAPVSDANPYEGNQP